MDTLLLSRWQFGITAAFHFIFPSFTIGLSMLIFIYFLLYMLKKDEIYRKIGNFFVRIFAIGFAVGVATGIVMEFQFGTNWSRFSEAAGGVFGGPLAFEAMLAFFLESTFLAILIFGEKKVSPLMRTISAFLVMIGTFISGFWILTALNWMQIPTGYEVTADGKILLKDFLAIMVNKPNIIRFIHTILACFIAGSALVLGVSAYKFIKNENRELYSKSFSVAIWVFVISSILQIFAGTMSGEYVAKHQPLKLAIMEALWNTQKGASEPVIAFIDQENMTNVFEVGIPGLLSFLAYGDPSAEVKGIKQLIEEYNLHKDELPSIPLVFWSFRGMVALGVFFVLLGITGVILYYTKKLFDLKWLLLTFVFTIPLPIIANWLGWIVTEVGRQPWVIYGIMKTKHGVSELSTGEVGFTLSFFIGIYALLLVLWIMLTVREIRKGA